MYRDCNPMDLFAECQPIFSVKFGLKMTMKQHWQNIRNCCHRTWFKVNVVWTLIDSSLNCLWIGIVCAIAADALFSPKASAASDKISVNLQDWRYPEGSFRLITGFYCYCYLSNFVLFPPLNECKRLVWCWLKLSHQIFSKQSLSLAASLLFTNSQLQRVKRWKRRFFFCQRKISIRISF